MGVGPSAEGHGGSMPYVYSDIWATVDGGDSWILFSDRPSATLAI